MKAKTNKYQYTLVNMYIHAYADDERETYLSSKQGHQKKKIQIYEQIKHEK